MWKIQGRRASFAAVVRQLLTMPADCKPTSIAYHSGTQLLFVGDVASNKVHIVHGETLLSNITIGEGLPTLSVDAVHGLAVRATTDGDDATGELVVAVWPHSLVLASFNFSNTAVEVCQQVLLGAAAQDDGDGTHDDVAALATLWQPRGVVCAGRSVLFADNKKGVRLLTSTGPLTRIIGVHIPCMAAIGFQTW